LNIALQNQGGKAAGLQSRDKPGFTARRLVFEEQAGFLGIGLEITDRKQAEQALRAAKEDLARANQELEQRVQQRTAKLQEALSDLEQMSYSMIHDMRAPLRAMHNYAALEEGMRRLLAA
jgi:signal transduction histidine kinase